MLEKDIEKKVCAYSREKGVTGYKFTSPARAAVPDRLFAFPGGRAVFIEFKQTGKKPTAAQWREIDRLRAQGFRVYTVDNTGMGLALVDWHLGEDAPCPLYMDPARSAK